MDYQDLLNGLYPESVDEISEIIVPNPADHEVHEGPIRHRQPHLFGHEEGSRLHGEGDPAVDGEICPDCAKNHRFEQAGGGFLEAIHPNQSLLDIISQHFFHETPAFFALSYLKLYLDYYYPVGGTGKFIEKMVGFIESHQGQISNNTEIQMVDPQKRLVMDAQGNQYSYRRLIWAADLKTFYRMVNLENIEAGPG